MPAAAIAWLLSVSHCRSVMPMPPPCVVGRTPAAACSESTTDESTTVRSPPPDRSSAATSTSVAPSWRRARTQTRRGRMNSEPSSPTRARTTPSRVSQTSGVRLIWSRVQCLTPLEGDACRRRRAAATVWPGCRSTRNIFPSGFFSCVMLGLVQRVDRLRHPAVQAEVADVGQHRERRVPVVAHHVDGVAVDHGEGRVEQPLEPDVRARACGPGALTTPKDSKLELSGRKTVGPS